MTKQNIVIGVAGIVIGLILSAVFGGSEGAKLGGVYEINQTHFSNGFFAGSSDQFEVSSAGVLTTSGALTASGDVTFSGGTLNVTTSNTATSTIVGGCFQFYATSTATAHKFQASTTPGIMYSAYGACPNL